MVYFNIKNEKSRVDESQVCNFRATHSSVLKNISTNLGKKCSMLLSFTRGSQQVIFFLVSILKYIKYIGHWCLFGLPISIFERSNWPSMAYQEMWLRTSAICTCSWWHNYVALVFKIPFTYYQYDRRHTVILHLNMLNLIWMTKIPYFNTLAFHSVSTWYWLSICLVKSLND